MALVPTAAAAQKTAAATSSASKLRPRTCRAWVSCRHSILSSNNSRGVSMQARLL